MLASSGSAGTVAEIAVDTLTLRAASLARREALQAAVLAAAVGGLVALLGPSPGDAPAHLYRTDLVRHGVLVWDNLWYAGHYPLAAYSLLYYFPAALFGNVPLVLAAVAAAAFLFARIAFAEWGDAARWPARAFALAACAPLFTGTYAWAAGCAALLGSLRALQLRRPWVAVVLAALTFGFSPLAFLFLGIALAALALTRRPSRRTLAIAGGGWAAVAGIGLAFSLVFASPGRYGFPLTDLLLALLVASVAALCASRSREGRLLVALLLVWGLACAVAFLVPSPIGSNVIRFKAVAFPLVLLAAALSGYRPRWLALFAVVGSLAYTVTPYAMEASVTETRPASRSFWAPALAFLRAHGSPSYRVDVVPTFDNWEAYYVPDAGFALARGWYRQLDLERNPVLYRPDLTAADYRAWLRSVGVRYVVLPLVARNRQGAAAEAALLESGRSGLTEVFRAPALRIYELPRATPILTGPARAELTALGHSVIAGRVGAPGAYLLRARSTPYRQVTEGDVCLEAGPDGTTRLVARRAGRFALDTPGPWALLRTAFGARPSRC